MNPLVTIPIIRVPAVIAAVEFFAWLEVRG
jgi:hypothetical protein